MSELQGEVIVLPFGATISHPSVDFKTREPLEGQFPEVHHLMVDTVRPDVVGSSRSSLSYRLRLSSWRDTGHGHAGSPLELDFGPVKGVPIEGGMDFSGGLREEDIPIVVSQRVSTELESVDPQIDIAESSLRSNKRIRLIGGVVGALSMGAMIKFGLIDTYKDPEDVKVAVAAAGGIVGVFSTMAFGLSHSIVRMENSRLRSLKHTKMRLERVQREIRANSVMVINKKQNEGVNQ